MTEQLCKFTKKKKKKKDSTVQLKQVDFMVYKLFLIWKNVMLCEWSKTQNTIYYTIPSTWHVQKRQIYGVGKVCDCLKLGVGTGINCKQAWGISMGWWKYSKTGLYWLAHHNTFTQII